MLYEVKFINYKFINYKVWMCSSGLNWLNLVLNGARDYKKYTNTNLCIPVEIHKHI